MAAPAPGQRPGSSTLSEPLASLAWRPAQLAQGIDRLVGSNTAGTRDPLSNGSTGTIEAAVASAVLAIDIDPIPLTTRFENTARCIAGSTPLVVPLSTTEALLVVRANLRTATLIAPDGAFHRIPMRKLQALLEVPLPDEIEATITRLEREVSPAVASTFRSEQQNHRPVFAGWKIPTEQFQSSTGIWTKTLIGRVAGLVAVHVTHFGLWILSWVSLVSALLGVGDRDSLLALWMVALVSSLLLLPIESLLQQKVATRIGIAIKQTLLKNALGMDQAMVREHGIGQLIAQALEANRLDALATQGGLRVLLSAFDGVCIIVAFIWFAGFQPLLLLFLLANGLAVRWWVEYYRAEQRQHAAHLSLTALHTEEMIGHRTRKAFLGRSQWHRQEESCLEEYEQACAMTDRAALGSGSVPRLWAVSGVAVILLGLFGQSTATLTSVALIGFVIVGFGVLHGASMGILKLLRALVLWKHVNELHQQNPAAISMQAPSSSDMDDGSQLIIQGLGYSYPKSAQQVIRDVNLRVPASGKVLLTGNSGSGKSTLGALMAGRLQPATGTILSQGLDRHITGARGWLKQVCYVPQSSANHVLTDTFAFNLLLGREWPPTADDLNEAVNVAGSLGLGPLMEKMPAGVMQMVGEGGWRLSQGEQARLFLARGILQGARVLVIDELLSPLDPGTSLEVLEAVERMPSQLILIAHT